MVGRELEPEERANMLLYISGERSKPDLKVISYSPGTFARAERGTKHLTMSGQATQKLARDLAKFQATNGAGYA